MIKLNFDITFEDLYSTFGLKKIDKEFIGFLNTKNIALRHDLIDGRKNNQISSELIIKLAPYLESFIINLFNLKYNENKNPEYHKKASALFECRKKFIQRKVKFEDHDEKKIPEAISILNKNSTDLDNELSIAINILKWLSDNNEELLKAAKIYVAWALYSKEGKAKYNNGILFKIPKKLHFDKLIEYSESSNKTKCFDKDKLRARNGFDFTDHTINQHTAIVNANYCLYCHKQDKDSCSKGLVNKTTSDIIKNPLEVELKGCPLKEKISEMNFLKKEGIIIGAFATAIIDNPMIAATGHRICNDCMKSCIYQKQEPVDIPLIETKILDDVLKLDYGFEIYSLLTKWNPLKSEEYLPKELNNYKVLIVGMGPAGFTLSHYLINEGFTVVGIDGLKIEPIQSKFSGIMQDGSRANFKPIKNISEIEEKLSERKAYGFGGVAEYGITVRWNKNYLTVLRLMLERRENFKMYGSIRFGSTINYKSAKELGFSHVALAIGAGKPNIPEIPNILCKGARSASDFLMTLQTLGTSRKNSIANLQIRLPIVVIGGGLTSIDTATESLAYYPIMVEKFLTQYEELGDTFLKTLDDEELEVALEFIKHAKELRINPKEKLLLLKKWGGVKIIYRKKFEESPAYKLNHEEVVKAFEEGIEFVDNTCPIEIILDKFNHCEGIICNNQTVWAKTILIATGTAPNTTLAREDPEHFKLNGKYFSMVKEEQNSAFFTNIEDDFSISILGDSHPKYSGSVVKAMASAKNSYKSIAKEVLKYNTKNVLQNSKFFKKLNNQMISKIIKVNRLTQNVVEIFVKSPLAASEFRPGQFYRLQNYESNAKINNGYLKAIEPLALTGASVDKIHGIVSLIVLEMGGSSNFCQDLEPGEIISLMGPTGSPTYIPKNENVILIGGGLGNAVLFSIGKALIDNGCHVLYFAGYKRKEDIFKPQEIEKAANQVVWCCDESELRLSNRTNKSFHGNIVKALENYDINFSDGLKLKDFNRMLTIGSDLMMKAVSYAIQNDLKNLFDPNIKSFASINSPMQCMMKEICAQCLQKHVNPKTKEISYVYSCFNQDQNLKHVDFEHLFCRLKQNSLLEKMTSNLN